MAEELGDLSAGIELDSEDFRKGFDEVRGLLKDLAGEFASLGDAWKDAGKAMTAGVTVPVVGIGAAVLKTAGDFESAMGKVAISTGAAGDEIGQLRQLALDIGKDTVFGATEAAGALDDLAKTGLTAAQILGGAGKAAADLAAATGTDLAPAAIAVSDSMKQFKIELRDLPATVDQITGAVNESKLSFNDYQLAIAQAGGVAGGLGVEFIDFNAALAGTSALFASGSDAGTSFKVFLQRLSPTSKQAAAMIREYGLSFYDAQGNLRSMGEIAQTLREGLGGLSEEAKNMVLSKIFGTDAMRTAIGLMDQGAAGIERIRSVIAETDAAAQSAERMKGFNAQLATLAGAFEKLSIAIADTGILNMVTGMVTKVADFISWLAETQPGLLKFATGLAIAAAAIGPLMLLMALLAAVVLPLFLLRLGPIATAISLIINPVGTLIGLLPGLITQFGGWSTILGTVGRVLLRVAGLPGLIVTAFLLIKDQVLPVLAELWNTAKETLGPKFEALFGAVSGVVDKISAAFNSLMNGPAGQAIGSFVDGLGEIVAQLLRLGGTLVIGALNILVTVFTHVFKQIGDIVDFIVAVFQGDWKKAWESLGSLVENGISAVLEVLGIFSPQAAKYLAQVYVAAKAWLSDKLGQVFDWVKGAIRDVGATFAWLYDVVVGNSYIPDMVTEIGQHMAKLDANLVKPAAKATKAAAAEFEALAGRIGSLFARLYPDQAANLAFQKQMADLRSWFDQGRISAELYRDAVMRAINLERGDAPTGVGAEAIARDDPVFEEWQRTLKDGVIAPAEDARDETVEAFADMVEGVARGVQDLVGAIRGGDIFDVLSELIGLASQLGPMLGLWKAQTPQGGANAAPAPPPFGGFRAAGGPVVPGRRYIVGENGPEWFAPRMRGAIVPANDRGRAPAVVQLVVGEGQMFEPRVTSISGGVSVQTMRAGARAQALRGRQRLA